jgi:hypothetical protein
VTDEMTWVLSDEQDDEAQRIHGEAQSAKLWQLISRYGIRGPALICLALDDNMDMNDVDRQLTLLRQTSRGTLLIADLLSVLHTLGGSSYRLTLVGKKSGDTFCRGVGRGSDGAAA